MYDQNRSDQRTFSLQRVIWKVAVVAFALLLIGLLYPREAGDNPVLTRHTHITTGSDASLTITDANLEAALSTHTGCSTTSFPIGGVPSGAAAPTDSEMWVSSSVSSCVKASDNVMLWRSATGEFEFNRISSVGPPSGGHVLLSFAKTLSLPQTGSASFNVLVRALHSVGDIVLSPQSSPFGGKAWDGSSGGVMLLWSENNVVLKRDIDVSSMGFRGGVVSSSQGPEGPNGRLTQNGGGGGGGAPGHGCNGSPGWKTNLIGHGVDGAGNPVEKHGTGGDGGVGSPNGGGGGGAGYGYHAGAGGAATNPGGAGGSKLANAGQSGHDATGPRGGGGGGGADRDNGGGGGGGTPVSSQDNMSASTKLLLGGGAASGAGGGGGGGQGDYQCAAGGSGGYKLGKGGLVGGDTCPHTAAQQSTAGSDGSNGGSGGGLVVLVGKTVTIESGVKILAQGGAGGNGGSGGKGTHGLCHTHPYGGAGGGGGGADGAAGGTVAHSGTLTNSGSIDVNGGAGGVGGAGGANGRGKGGKGGNGGAGANGHVLQIAAPSLPAAPPSEETETFGPFVPPPDGGWSGNGAMVDPTFPPDSKYITAIKLCGGEYFVTDIQTWYGYSPTSQSPTAHVGYCHGGSTLTYECASPLWIQKIDLKVVDCSPTNFNGCSHQTSYLTAYCSNGQQAQTSGTNQQYLGTGITNDPQRYYNVHYTFNGPLAAIAGLDTVRKLEFYAYKTPPAGAWEKFYECDGPTGTKTWHIPAATLVQRAQTETFAFKFEDLDHPTDVAFSSASNTLFMDNLKAGKALSKIAGPGLWLTKTWCSTNIDAATTEIKDAFFTWGQSGHNLEDIIYWAEGNPHGLHVSATHGWCNFVKATHGQSGARVLISVKKIG